MLETIKQQLKSFPVAPVLPESGNSGSTAAVLLILHGEPDNPLLVLTERAQHLNSYAGEVAFPGGMWDSDDRDLLCTALRETEEEIGLPPNLVTPIAMLPSTFTRDRNLVVRPFVGLVESPLKLKPEPAEIASVFDLPIAALTELNRYQYFEMGAGAGVVKFPYFEYQSYRVWGFTLKVMVDMLNITLGTQIKLRYPTRQQFEKLDHPRNLS
ncbi:MAG: CoA pyrophosphatase [Porticoccaceae bacterium]|nr:CoA pyrophosphatase [Porticoccaceae bacterium]